MEIQRNATKEERLAATRALKKYGNVPVNAHGFRPNTPLTRHIYNYMVNNGGLGDYINYMSAFEFMANEYPQVRGRIFVKEPFKSVAEYIMSPYPEWKVYDPIDAPKLLKEGEILHNPAQWHRYINATGAHLMDIGWKYLMSLDRPLPGWDRLPDLTDYESGKTWPIKGDYAVVTPGYTSAARAIPAVGFNEICRYLLQHNITPVFLGKHHFAESNIPGQVHPDYHMKMQENIDLSLGIDLLNQTTLLEATEIMSHAKMVIGVDNGLLHFAGCTEVPIIFGHTVTTIEDRAIRRPVGLTYNITASEKDLPCIGCQSKMRCIPGHDFKYCFYEDYQCLIELFKDNSSKWKQAIDVVLKHEAREDRALHFHHPHLQRHQTE